MQADGDDPSSRDGELDPVETGSAPEIAGVDSFLVVRWENVEESWCWLDMRVGKKLLLMGGSPDPYPGMVEWVERCCTKGASPKTWFWDSESVQYLFTYIRMSCFLRIEELDWGAKPVEKWSGTLTVKELHRAFYQGFLDFVESDEFEPLLWCSYSLREWLDWFLGDRARTLAEEWIKCDSKTLDRDLHSILRCDLSWRVGRFEGLPPFESERLDWRSTENFQLQIAAPEDWDRLPEESRWSRLTTLLETNLGGRKEHPRSLRSRILDDWWLENREREDGEESWC